MIEAWEEQAPDLTPENFINRELSTIDFQKRVLALAEDESTPLLERVKFIAIVGNNLDEFYMVRVGAYFQRLHFNNPKTRPDGITPTQLLRRIHEEVSELIARQRKARKQVFELLANEGLHFITTDQLSQGERNAITYYFRSEVYPVLTPLAVDHARPFPFISNLSLNLGVYLERDNGEMARASMSARHQGAGRILRASFTWRR